jgi:hypothetical protein
LIVIPPKTQLRHIQLGRAIGFSNYDAANPDPERGKRMPVAWEAELDPRSEIETESQARRGCLGGSPADPGRTTGRERAGADPGRIDLGRLQEGWAGKGGPLCV